MLKMAYFLGFYQAAPKIHKNIRKKKWAPFNLMKNLRRADIVFTTRHVGTPVLTCRKFLKIVKG